MFERMGILLKRRSKSVALVLGLLVIPAAFAIPKLRFDFTPQAIFEGDDDLVSTAEDVRHTFGYDDAVVLLILADDETEAGSVAEAASGVDLEPQVTLPTLLWQAEVLTAIEDAGAVESVASLTRAELPVIVKPRPIELGSRPLLPYDDIELDELPLVQSALTNSPLLRKRFLGANGRDLIAYLQLGPDRRKYEGMQTAVSAIRKVLADHPAPEGKRAFLSGLPPLRVQVVEDLHAEQKRLMPLTALILVIVLGLLFRSAVWAALPLIAVGLGLIYTVGTVAAAGGSFSLVTNILPLLLFILGVTNAAHIVTRYGEECRRTPNDRYAAALSTIQHLGLACLLTALTTACGFLSLLVARASVLQQLAWQAAVGLFLVYFATITVFGITLWRFRPPWMREGGDSKPRLPAIERALIATSNLVLARPWLVLIGSLLLIGLAVTSGLSVRPDGLMTEMYDPDHPQVQTLGYVERNLGGFVTLDIDLRAEPEHELTRADVMQRVLSLERQLAGEPLVISSESFASLLETVREGPLGSAAGDTAPALTDDRVREVLQAVAPVRDVLGLPHFLTSNNERGRVQVRVRDAGTQQTLALIRSIEDRLGALLPASVGVKHRVTGDAAVNAVALDSVIRDLAGSLALASILIFGLMSVLLRSARVGLVASLPNLTPLVLTLGYMGLRGYPLNTSNAIVFTISLGIAVDDSVHFLVRAYEEFSAGRTVDEAIRAAMIGTGRAMVMTTIVLVCGLSALYLSDFVPNRRFAELTSLTMVSALIGDLLLLPACLKLFWQGKGAE